MKIKLCYVLATAIGLGGVTAHAEIKIEENRFDMQQNQLTKKLTQEQARQAILKMAGEYEVGFRFEEVYAAKDGYALKPADISKAKETVIVLLDTPEKISLQHLLVVKDHVVKHWRQDWEYQPQTAWTHIGNYQWQKRAISSEEASEKWLQTVWQVDDSPRYAGLGTWENDHGITAWTSENTYRPLPRRELTTRDDYDTIIGVNRQALTANGWVHEQNNIKYDSKTQQPIARELGVNTYVKVENVNFKPAYDYWEKNKQYWGAVRQAWDQAFVQNEVLGLPFTRQKDDDKTAHYVQFMKQAKDFAGKSNDESKLKAEVKKLFNEQLTSGKIN